MSNALAFELSADSAGLDAGLRAAEKQFSQFGGKVSADLKGLVASFASYEAFKGLIGNTVSAAKEIRNFSKQAGISTDEVQQLQKAAGKTGLEFEDFQTGLSKMGVARRSAAEDDQKLLNFFNHWGISLKDLENPQLRNIDLLKKMAASMQGVTLTSAQRTEFRDVFGKAGEKLIESIQQLAHLGPIKLISESDIESIYQADRALSQLLKNWQKLSAPAIGAGAQFLSNRLGEVGDEGAKARQDAANKLFEHYQKKGDQAGALAAGSFTASTFASSPEEQLEEFEKLMLYARGRSQHGKGKAPDVLLKSIGAAAFAPEKPLGEMHGPMLPGSKEAALHDKTNAEKREAYAQFIEHTMDLQERVQKINFEMLTPKEQQLDLQKRINAELAEAARLSKINPTEAQNRKLAAAALNDQLLSTSNGKPSIPGLDSAGTAGGFIGGSVNFNPSNYSDNEMVSLTQQVRDNTAKIAEKIAKPPAPPPKSIYSD